MSKVDQCTRSLQTSKCILHPNSDNYYSLFASSSHISKCTFVCVVQGDGKSLESLNLREEMRPKHEQHWKGCPNYCSLYGDGAQLNDLVLNPPSKMADGKYDYTPYRPIFSNPKLQMVALLAMEAWLISVQDRESIELWTVLHCLEVHWALSSKVIDFQNMLLGTKFFCHRSRMYQVWRGDV